MKTDLYKSLTVLKKSLFALCFLSLAFGTQTAFSQAPCTAPHTGGCGISRDFINNFKIYHKQATYSHSNTECSSGSYFDFGDPANSPAYQGDDFVLQQNTSYPWEARFGDATNIYMGIWIDFDNDASFSSSENVYLSNQAFTKPLGSTNSYIEGNGNIVIPQGVAIGTGKRMRVRVRTGTAITAGNGCSSFSSGETHDYRVNIVCGTMSAGATNITGDNEVCKSNTTKSYTSSTITGASSYAWSLPPGATIVGAATGASITVDFSAATSGDISVAGVNVPSCNNTSLPYSELITVRPPAVAGALTGDLRICRGTNLTQIEEVYSIASITGATNYLWSTNIPGAQIKDAATGGDRGSTRTSITIIYDGASGPNSAEGGAGNISVTVSNICSAGPIKNFGVITNNTAPATTATPMSITGDELVCSGENLPYGVPTTERTADYLWELPSGASIISGDSTTSVMVNYSNSSVNGTIRVIPSNGCGNGTPYVSKAITVPQPVATTGAISKQVSSPSSVCQGENNVVYLISPVNNATTYTWERPLGTDVVSGSNSPSITLNFKKTATSGDLKVTASNECYAGTQSPALAITVNPLPDNPGAITGKDTVCQGQTGVTYAVPAIANATIYHWTLPAGASIVGPSTESSIEVNFSSTASQGNIKVYASNSCGIGKDTSFAVKVIPTPGVAGAITGPSVVCQANNSVSYSIPTVTNAAYYLWTVPTGAIKVSGDSTNSIIVDFTNAVSENITVKGVALKNCGNSNTATLAVTVTPSIPGAAGTITGKSAVCPGESGVSYSVSSITGATGYAWSLPAGATIASGSNTNSITVNFPANASPGDISVMGTNVCGNGNSSQNFPVTISSALPDAADAIAGLATPCQGATGVGYKVPAITNATSYIWTVPTGATIVGGQGTDSITVDFSTTFTSGNITVKGSNACGNGTASSKSINPNLFPAAAGTISGSATVCPGQATAYSIPDIANATGYNWVLPAGATITSGTNTRSITVSFSTTSGNITVNGTNSCGSGATSNKAITVDPLPAAAGTISGPSAICQGQTNVVFTVSPITNATGYNWQLPAGATITAGSNTQSITVSFSSSASSGNIIVNGTNTCGGGTISSLPITLSNSAPGTAGTITGPATACQGELGVSFSVGAVTNAAGYTWNLGTGATIASGPNTNNITVNFSASATSGSRSISVFATNGCGTGNVSPGKSITINPLPASPGTVTGDSIVCHGENGVTYSVSAIANATGYTWSIPSGTAIASGFNTNTITVNYSNTAATGNVSVNGTNSCGSGASSANRSVIVNAFPAAAGTITGLAAPCQGQTGVVYSVPAIANATSYVWTVPTTGATIVSGQGTDSITVDYSSSAASGNITVLGRNTCGDGAISSKSITVNTLPATAGAISGSATVCQGQNNVVYSITGIPNVTSYIWSVPAGVTKVADDSTNTITVNYSSTATNGNISVLGRNACGDGGSSSKLITVNPLPVAAGTISGPATACQGETGVAFSVPIITNATGYNWSLPSGATITAGANTDSITVSFSSSAASGNITANGTNSCGSGTPSTSHAVGIFPLPAAAGIISGPATVCQGQTGVSYSVPAITNATGYTWSLPPGASITGGITNGGDTTNSITVSFSSTAASGNVTVKGTNNCGSGATANKVITVNPLPAAAGTITGTASVCHGQNNVVYSVTGIANATHYIWSIPAGATKVADDSTNTITVNYPSSAVSGNVSVFGKNSCGNGAISNKSVTVKPFPAASGTISGPATPCKGDTVTYAVSAIANATGYNWVLPASTNVISGSNTESITVSFPASATSFNISVNGTNSCGSGTASANYGVTINPFPSDAGIISGKDTVCLGEDSVAYQVPAIANADYYIWSMPAGASIISGDSTNSILVNFSATAVSGDITVMGENDCGNGKDTSFAVVVNAVIGNAGTITGTDTVCQGQLNVTYNIPTIAGADYYIWTLPAGATIASGDSTESITVDFSPAAVSGNISVFAANACGNGTPSPNFGVIVNILPDIADPIAGRDIVCPGDSSVSYSVPVIGNATGYNWTVPANATLASTSANGDSITVHFGPGALSGNITVSGINGCGNGVAAIFEVTILQPVDSAHSISGTDTVCQGQDSVAYEVPLIPNANHYIWSLPDGASIVSGDSTNIIKVNFSRTAVSGNIIVYGVNNCFAGDSSTPFAVTVNPLPDSAEVITGLDLVCPGTTGVVYTVPQIANTAPNSYIWNLPAGLVITAGDSTNSITVDFPAAPVTGNYGISVAALNGCGYGISSSIDVTINTVPTPSFNYTIEPSDSATVIFENTSTNADTSIWIYGDGSPADTAVSPTHQYLNNGSYLVFLTTLNACGSSNTNKIIQITNVGIEEELKNGNVLNVYPNPTTDQFNVNFNGLSSMLQVKLISTSGSVIYNEKINKFSGKFQKLFDLKESARGVYFLQIITDEQVITRKVVLN